MESVIICLKSKTETIKGVVMILKAKIMVDMKEMEVLYRRWTLDNYTG